MRVVAAGRSIEGATNMAKANEVKQLLAFGMVLICAPAWSTLFGQQGKIVLSEREKPILEQIGKLRGMPDDERIRTERRLAVEIRQLPAEGNKEALADSLAHLVTEGDPGRETLQEVATTLALAVREKAPAGDADEAYATLAEFARYEHVRVDMADDPRFAAAMAKLEAEDRGRETADFTLADLNGKNWRLKDLRGSVVLVNFWATWCPPCRKEMPDLETLYQRFGPKGLVVLAISDEEEGKVRPYIAEHHFSYPTLLDPGRKVSELFYADGIPKSFVFNREGKMVAQGMDMRTMKQFLEMLGSAGLE